MCTSDRDDLQGVYEARGLMVAWREMLEQIFDSAPADAIGRS